MVGQLPHPSQPSVFSSPSLAPYGAAPPGALAPPYQGYSLANVDMSSFQGIDWTNVYNVGIAPLPQQASFARSKAPLPSAMRPYLSKTPLPSA
ncbi:hypothetical protein HAZT_HAZT008678 [Hyalella azteca]|uniref:Uncharacterized protein n=1 Tax=Hyalella azteca TaxID=294128 RepID=A0A6A0H7C2_HYAAZ|nr:hypothetical protein HAZT_HAZT008678 [Hyalella azteca]